MSELNFIEKLLDGVDVEWKTLGKTCKIETGKLNANAAVDDGEYMFFTTAKETSKIDKFRWDTEALLIAGNANVGEVKHYIGKFEAYQRTYVLTNFDENVSVRFLYFVLSHSLKKYLEERTNSAAMTYIVLSTLENFPIPIPCPKNPEKSLEIQAEIVRILDTFTALTDELKAELFARKKQYEYYREKLFSFEDGDVEWQPLGEIGEFIRGNGMQKKDFVESGFPAIHYGQIYTKYGLAAEKTFTYVSEGLARKLRKASKGDLLLATTSENDEDVVKPLAWHGQDVAISGDMMLFRHRQNVKYLAYFIQTEAFQEQKRKYISGAKVRRVSSRDLAKISVIIPCPENPKKSLEIQDEIVRILDNFSDLIDEINSEIECRQKQYEYYRELLLSFPVPPSEQKSM